VSCTLVVTTAVYDEPLKAQVLERPLGKCLRLLDVEDNSLSGDPFGSLSKVTGLSELNLAWNLFSGSPSRVSSLTSLRYGQAGFKLTHHDDDYRGREAWGQMVARIIMIST
jgi:hypothetical protein